ncbi:hypothetical protein ACU4GA_00865 [Methylobacterium oryzae CBMB20]
MVRRDGFASLAELEEWIDGLRALMAALGAPVSQSGRAGVTGRDRGRAGPAGSIAHRALDQPFVIGRIRRAVGGARRR